MQSSDRPSGIDDESLWYSRVRRGTPLFELARPAGFEPAATGLEETFWHSRVRCWAPRHSPPPAFYQSIRAPIAWSSIRARRPYPMRTVQGRTPNAPPTRGPGVRDICRVLGSRVLFVREQAMPQATITTELVRQLRHQRP
jgi:hypothetical protein